MQCCVAKKDHLIIKVDCSSSFIISDVLELHISLALNGPTAKKMSIYRHA